MPAYGYLAYLVRATHRSRPRDLQRLSAMGHENIDLIELFRNTLVDLGNGYYSKANKAEGFRINRTDPHGRSEFIRIRRGPEGNPGETYDTETGTSVETNDKTALLSELRAALFVPEDSYFGFLFVERVGGRHLKDLVYTHMLAPISQQLNMPLRVEAFGEIEDWRLELAPQKVLRVTEVLKHSDSAQDASTVDDTVVKVTAEGSALRSMTDPIKDRVLDVLARRNRKYRLLADIAPYENRRRVWGQIGGKNPREGYKASPKKFFTVADHDELEALKLQLESLDETSESGALLDELQQVLPIDREDYKSQRVEVALGNEQPEKTFVVESDSVPQLVYPLGGRLGDLQLQRTWEAQAERFLATLGVTTPSGWLLEQ